MCDHFTSFSKKFIFITIFTIHQYRVNQKKNVINKIKNTISSLLVQALTKKMFIKLFRGFSFRKIPQIIKTGYLKLDYLIEKLKIKVPKSLLLSLQLIFMHLKILI